MQTFSKFVIATVVASTTMEAVQLGTRDNDIFAEAKQREWMEKNFGKTRTLQIQNGTEEEYKIMMDDIEGRHAYLTLLQDDPRWQKQQAAKKRQNRNNKEIQQRRKEWWNKSVARYKNAVPQFLCFFLNMLFCCKFCEGGSEWEDETTAFFVVYTALCWWGFIILGVHLFQNPDEVSVDLNVVEIPLSRGVIHGLVVAAYLVLEMGIFAYSTRDEYQNSNQEDARKKAEGARGAYVLLMFYFIYFVKRMLAQP